MDAIAAFADHVVRTEVSGSPERGRQGRQDLHPRHARRRACGQLRSHGARACRDGRDLGTSRGSRCLGQRQASAGAGGRHVQCLSGPQLGVRLRARGSRRACHDRGAAGGPRRRRANERCQWSGSHHRCDARRRCGRRPRRRRLDGVALFPAGDGGRVRRHRGARQAHGSRSPGHDQRVLDRLWPVLRHHAGA